MNKANLQEFPQDYSDLLHDTLIYKYALENSAIGVWDYDLVKNKIHHSKESKAIYGFHISDFDYSQSDWKHRIHPDDLEELSKIVDAHLKGETQEYSSEHRIVCKDGTYKWILDRGKIIAFDQEGKPTRFIGTTLDISKKKDKEHESSQSLSIISNQNKKLNNFAHIVTHNLKEYAGNFESLLTFYDEAQTEVEKSELIEHLKAVSTSLSRTIKNLNEIVQKQTVPKVKCKLLNVNEYITKITKLLELEIESKNAIINNQVSNDLFLYSNPAYLESIILNLASNALKYAHPDRRPVIVIASKVAQDAVVITLTDNGIGIDLDRYGDAIFGLYKTFHGNENAEGIGLYITKNQIETLGGMIEVESEVGIGTCFKITIKEKKQP